MKRINKILFLLPICVSLFGAEKAWTLREAYGARANAGAKLSKFMTPIQMATASVYYKAQCDQHGTPVAVHSKEESVQVFHNKSGFRVVDGLKSHDVEPAMMDKQLRTITPAQLALLQQKGLITVGRTTDGHYTLSARANGNGGGILGASFGSFIGKALAYGIGHGGIHLIALCTGPNYPLVAGSLTLWLSGPIEIASQGAAIAGGIVGGVITGPA